MAQIPMSAIIPKICADAHEAADLAEVLFRQETKQVSVTTAWGCVEGDLDETIGERARFADLLVLGQFDAENLQNIRHPFCRRRSCSRWPPRSLSYQTPAHSEMSAGGH
jgi:hypothetical protein